MSVIKPGWVRVTADDLSEFHRRLISTIPKYASIAVSEMMLPASADVLAYEERLLLGKQAPSDQMKKTFRDALADVVAKKPDYNYQQALQPTRNWSPPALSLVGVTGESHLLSFTSPYYFRVDRVEISDSLCGEGTEVSRMLVGGRVQRVLPGSYMRTSEAAPWLLDVLLDTCGPGVSIGIQVRFLKACGFRMVLSGKAVI